MESCLSAFRSPARIPRNKVLCGYDPQQLWNSLVDKGGPREPSFPHSAHTAGLWVESPARSRLICTQICAFMWRPICPALSRPLRGFFGCQNQSCLRHVTNFTVLVLADVSRPQDTLHLLLCGQKPWEVTQGEREGEREIHPARD